MKHIRETIDFRIVDLRIVDKTKKICRLNQKYVEYAKTIEKNW